MSIRSRRLGAVALYSFAVISALVTLVWVASSAIALNQGENPHLLTARAGHTATALADGSIVIAGGSSRKGYASGIEVYDVATTKSWAGPGLMTPRAGHTATLLADGSIMLVGGRNGTGALDSTETYNPATGAVSKGASLNQARTGHTATPLADGRILIAGGNESGVAEIYDPKTNAFYTVDKLAVARSGHSAIRLATGHVLLVGGYGDAAATAEIFDPVSMRFTPVSGGLKAARVQPTLNLMPDGKVHVYGGDSEMTMEVFSTKGYFSSRGHMLRDSAAFWSVLRSPGSAALVSLPGPQAKSATREVLGEKATAFERSGHSITQSSAKMIVAGGTDMSGGALDTISSFEGCGATVTTDLTDYYPGKTVIMSGAGWLPGEQIALVLHRDTNDPPDTFLYATADESGNWTNAEYVVQEFDLGLTFVLTATGESGCVAQTTFTDAGANTLQVRAGTTSPISGVSFTLNYREFSGSCPAASTATSTAAITQTTGYDDTTFGAGDKYLLVAPATASYTTPSAGTANFSHWLLPNGSTDVASAICINGSNSGVVEKFTAIYASSCAALTVPTGPVSVTITYGANTSFSATINGTGTITSQWQVSTDGGANFSDIGSPETSATLTRTLNLTNPLVLILNLQYRLRVVNPCGGPDIFSSAATLTVNKATPTVSASGGTFPYDGNPHTGACTVTGVGGADLGPLSPTYTPDPAPDASPVNAGGYTVHCDYPGSANYEATSNTAALTINAIDPTVTATGGTFDYNGAGHPGSCSVTGVGGADLGPLSPTYDPDPSPDAAPTNAGSYTVHCDYPGSTNYNAKGDTDSLTINAIDPTVTATGGTFDYNGAGHPGSCSVTGVGGADLGPLSPTYDPDPSPDAEPTNAGSYTVHCDYPGSTNYNAEGDTDSLTINAIDPTVTATGGTFDYNGAGHPGSCSVTGVGGADLGPLSPTYDPDPSPDAEPTNAGSYTVHCDYPGSTNYNAEGDTDSLTINAIDPTVTATGGTFDYNGAGHPGSCSVTGVGGADLGPLSPTYDPDPSPDAEPTNAGSYTVHCDYPGSTNYNAKSDTDSLTINAIDPTVTATGGTFDYNGAGHPGSCSVTGVGGADLGPLSPTYDPDPSPDAEPTDAGSYTVHCDYPGSTNYNAKSDTDSLTINAIDPTVTATGGTFNYNGSPHAGSCSVTGVGGADLGPLSPTYTPDPAPNAAPVNAGGYTVHCDYPGNTNYNAKSDTDSLTINAIDPTVTATGGTFNYNGSPHAGSCSVTGVGGADLGPLSPTYTPDPAPDAAPVNAGGYTVHCDYPGSQNYNAKSDTESLTINAIDPTVTATGGTFDYNGSPHAGSCSVTGVGGADLGPLSPTYTPDPAPNAAPVNAGGYTVHCDYPGSQNYNAKSDTAALTINRIEPTVSATGGDFTFNASEHPGSCSVTGLGGVDLGPLAPTYTPDPSPASAPVNAGTYTVHCDYPGSTNYLPESATATINIGARAALVNYIGQQVWVTSGSSATTAQVNLSASVQDPTGLALVGAKMTFLDITNGLPGKVLAANVPVAPVPNQPDATGTANKIVTLSTGQYGAESYIIRVVMTGNYDNTDQPTDDKTATVVVAKPATTNETCGVGEYVDLSSSAGLYKGVVGGDDSTFTVGLKYNKSGANLQGKITVSVPQADDSIIYIKSNSISSMAVSKTTPKVSTIYTKASVARVMPDGSVVTIDGNVTLRLDAEDGVPGKVAVTVLSSKDSVLYYSNQWLLVSNVWKTVTEPVKPGGFVTIK